MFQELINWQWYYLGPYDGIDHGYNDCKMQLMKNCTL